MGTEPDLVGTNSNMQEVFEALQQECDEAANEEDDSESIMSQGPSQ